MRHHRSRIAIAMRAWCWPLCRLTILCFLSLDIHAAGLAVCGRGAVSGNVSVLSRVSNGDHNALRIFRRAASAAPCIARRDARTIFSVDACRRVLLFARAAKFSLLIPFRAVLSLLTFSDSAAVSSGFGCVRVTAHGQFGSPISIGVSVAGISLRGGVAPGKQRAAWPAGWNAATCVPRENRRRRLLRSASCGGACAVQRLHPPLRGKAGDALQRTLATRNFSASLFGGRISLLLMGVTRSGRLFLLYNLLT